MADSRAYRKQFFAGNLVFLGICAGILFLVFLLSDLLSSSKIDMTADQVYTTSPATKEILGSLIDKVQVDYYVSEDLPSMLQDLKRDTRDLFEEFRELSGEMLHYSVIDPETLAEGQAAEKVAEYEKARESGETPEEPKAVQSIQQIFMQQEQPDDEQVRLEREKLAQKLASTQERDKAEVYRELLLNDFKRNILAKLEQEGIRPYPFTETEASSVRQVNAYTSISIRYLDKAPEIIPIHYSIESLEYEIASRVLKLTHEIKPVVAFFDARKPDAPPPNPMSPQPPPQSDYQGTEEFLGQFFDVRSIGLKDGDTLEDLVKTLKGDKEKKAREEAGDDSEPPEVTVEQKEFKDFVSCLVVAQPHSLEARQVYEINRAASLGIPTVFLVSRFSMDISQEGVQNGVPVAMLAPGTEFDDMLREWGVRLGDEMLATNPPNVATVDVPQQLPGTRFRVLRPYPFPVCVAPTGDEVNQEHSLTNRIQQLVFPATPGLVVDSKAAMEKKGLKSEVLVTTPAESWSSKVDPFARMQNPLQRHRGMGVSLFDYQEQLLQRKDPDTFDDFLDDPVPLAILIRGKLPFAFEGESVPEWKPPSEEPPGGMPPGMPGMGMPGMGMPGMPGGFPGLPRGDGDLQLDANDPAADAADGAVTDGAVTDGAADAAAGAAGGTPAGEAAEEKEPAPVAHVEQADGRVLVLASADMMKTAFLVRQDYRININFFQNCIETFGLGDLLLQIRRKQLTVRRFKPGSDDDYKWIIGFNVVLVPFFTALVGVGYVLLRRRRGVAYERQFIGK